jgi:hypothetical protein
MSKQMGSGNTEAYVLNGRTSLGVVTVNGSGTPTAWFFNVLAGDRVIGRQPNTGSRSYYQTDLLGSTRAVVQAASCRRELRLRALGTLDAGPDTAEWDQGRLHE